MAYFRKHYFNFNCFETIDNQDKAYWLGFIFADGSIRKGNMGLTIELSNKDIDHLHKFSEFMEYSGGIKGTCKDCSKIELNSKEFASYLNKLNVFHNKTYEKIIVPDIEKSLMRHFIRGVFDGDGWVVEHKLKKRGRISPSGYEFGFSSYDIDFLSWIKQWISQQINQDVGYIVDRRRPNQRVGQLIFGGRKVFPKIYNLFYKDSTTYLSRKYNTATRFLDIINLPPPEKTCINCGNIFRSNDSRKKYCCYDCGDEYRKQQLVA